MCKAWFLGWFWILLICIKRRHIGTSWSADDVILPSGSCLHFWPSFGLHSYSDSFLLHIGVEPGLSKLNNTTAFRCRVVLPVVYYSSGNLTFHTSQQVAPFPPHFLFPTHHGVPPPQCHNSLRSLPCQRYPNHLVRNAAFKLYQHDLNYLIHDIPLHRHDHNQSNVNIAP